MPRAVKDPVPAGPFQRFLNNYIADYEAAHGEGKGVARLLHEIGWWDLYKDHGERKLYRMRYGIGDRRIGRLNGPPGVRRPGRLERKEMTEYPRATVEDALHHAGVGFEEVYPPDRFPALFEDIPLEPEVFCPSCQDECTPIKGVCPWCEWDFGPRQLALAA